MDIGIPRPRHPMVIEEYYEDDSELYHPTDPPKPVSPEYEEDFKRFLYN